MGQVTSLLVAIGQGQQGAWGELYTLLHTALHRLAHSRIRRSSEIAPLDSTALRHESFLRFEKSGAVALADRDRFMAYAAHVMRSVVVDCVRSRQRERHGGGATHVEFDDALHAAQADPLDDEILRVHESLGELARIDACLVQVVQVVEVVQMVQVRCFSAMTEPEIAAVLGLTAGAVARDWEKARLFLHTQLR